MLVAEVVAVAVHAVAIKIEEDLGTVGQPHSSWLFLLRFYWRVLDEGVFDL